MRAKPTCPSERRNRRSARNKLRVETVEELRARGVVAVTKAQMAAAIQVTYRTIGEMMARGEIRFFRVGTRNIRIRMEEALRQMEERAMGGIQSPVTGDQWPEASGKGEG